MNEKAPAVTITAGACEDRGAYFGLAIPPWLEHAPLPPLLIVPSVHFTIAVLAAGLPVAFGFVVSAGFGGLGAAVFGLAAVVVGLLSLFDVDVFFTPPWLEQAPRPVAVEVVPSAHITVAGLA